MAFDSKLPDLMLSQEVVMLDLIQHPVLGNVLEKLDSGFRQNDDI